MLDSRDKKEKWPGCSGEGASRPIGFQVLYVAYMPPRLLQLLDQHQSQISDGVARFRIVIRDAQFASAGDGPRWSAFG